METKIGIYQIINIKNGKRYIGGTTNLKSRKRQHFSDLKLNKHGNKNLQEEYNKFEKEDFKFIVLEYVFNYTEEYLVEREQHWIDFIHPEYNINTIAGKYMGDYIRTKEAIEKAVKSRKDGLPHRKQRKPIEWKSGKNPRIGTHISEEQKKKISLSLSGEKHFNYGKQRSEETKAKMRVSHDKKLKRLISPDGTYYEFTNVMQFCREQGIENFGSVYALIRGDIPSYKGWKTAFVN